MDISIGIVGLPNVGKSTLFNSLTMKGVAAENFPFCTIDPSVGVVSVPDSRLQKLSDLSSSKKIVPAVIEFVDIAGLVKGAADGSGLGNSFLSHIRNVDAIVHMVRCFKDDGVIHVDGDVNPIRDIDVIRTELILADLGIVERRLSKLSKDVKRGDEDSVLEKKILEGVHSVLLAEKPASSFSSDDDINRKLSSLGLLTVKPMMYVCNGDICTDEIKEYVSDEVVVVPDLCDGFSEDALFSVIRSAYSTLGLISFLTTGDSETRAWSVPRGSFAPAAAGVIHSDFEKKFIRAEVISFDELLASGSYSKAKSQGLVRIEGKSYVIKDGDVVLFRTG